MESDRDCGVAAACDQRVTTVTRPASRDLRAKAVGNQPAKNLRVKEVLRPPVSSSDEVSENLDACSLNNSDEDSEVTQPDTELVQSGTEVTQLVQSGMQLVQ
ncbi:hypothetical protein PInf_008845 [Phytophthora infestans]|nr:hypothetical protein PInf_008845 [Phytophthora infestans]